MATGVHIRKSARLTKPGFWRIWPREDMAFLDAGSLI
jgi:hypothetical protein